MDKQKIIISGLGNPGRRYQNTPHNMGFHFIDFLADQYNLAFQAANKKLFYAETNISQKKIYLLKPNTFMNLSGEAIVPFCRKADVPPSNIWVVHDEVELPLGIWKEKIGGGHKGHNGLRNIMALFSADFLRIRLGVGRPLNPNMSLADFLLSKLPTEDIDLVHSAFGAIQQHLESWIENKD